VSDSIGLSREVARETLDRLVAEKNSVLELMKEKGYLVNPFLSTDSSKPALEFKLNDLRRQIAEVREYHSLHLLGSLDSESKRLTALVESLDSESKRLTSLNRWLIGLTIALIASTLALVVRAFIG
jgi:DNA-binding FadR family transcriptional regulator